MPRQTVEQRFWSKVRKTDLCWFWMGAVTPKGYGRFWDGCRTVYPYRYSYELHIGPIPEGLTIDHLCCNPRCVNPDHLEVASHRDNILRGNNMCARNARKTHCKRGHEFTPENTYHFKSSSGRRCRACHIAATKSSARRKD